MKVLLVNCVYGHGSTGVIIKNLHHALLNNNIECSVCYSRGNLNDNPNILRLAPGQIMQLQALCSRITGDVYGCSYFSTRRLKKAIRDFKPDVVNLHCINANTVNVADIITYLKENNIATVVSLHAEFLYTGGCGHALDCLKWLNGCNKCPQFKQYNSQLPTSWFFDKSDKYWNALYKAYSNFNHLVVTGVSPWLTERAANSPFFRDKTVMVVENGVDISIFKPQDTQALKCKLGIGKNSRIYVHPTPNFKNPLKGGQYIIAFAQNLKKIDYDARILIVGFAGDKKDLPDNIIPIGHIRDSAELASYYSLADVTLLASERETFSMVTAESLCCGTPVVGFKAGGPESICTRGHAEFVKYGDVEEYTRMAITIKKTSDISSDYSPIFSNANMVNNYIKAYKIALGI